MSSKKNKLQSKSGFAAAVDEGVEEPVVEEPVVEEPVVEEPVVEEPVVTKPEVDKATAALMAPCRLVFSLSEPRKHDGVEYARGQSIFEVVGSKHTLRVLQKAIASGVLKIDLFPFSSE